MRIKAGIIGTAVAGLALSAHAFTSPYTSMAIPGEHNGWSTTGSMVLMADNVWVGTQTLSSATGFFKFAANDGWAISWGCAQEGSVTIVRVPAAASAAVPGGQNLKYSNFSNGLYRFTFNDSTLEFQMEWVDASPLPLPGITNLYVVGDFNGWTPGASSRLTNSPANTNLWSGTLTLENSTAFQFYLNNSWDNQFGAPEASTITLAALNVPATNRACGKSDYTLNGLGPGIYVFALDTSNNLFTVVQTATQSFTIATMTVQGNFIGTPNPPVNMERVGDTSVWASDHHVTNASPFTLRFSANGGVRRWGATNGTPAFALPAAGTLLTNMTNYAQVTIPGATTGRYRATFNHLTGEFTLQKAYTDDSGINLLANPGFEQGADGGGNAPGWGGWQAWPKNVGDGYGPHSGSWCGAIHGKYEDNPSWTDYGSFTQDVPVEEGKTYAVSAWFRTTPNWAAESIQIKLEWKDAAGASAGSDDIANLPALSTNWTRQSLSATAPAGAVTSHVVFLCSGATNFGSTMQIDDAEMRTAAGRTQNFDTWGALTNFDAFAPDWSVTSGRTVENVQPERPPAAVFISQYVEGTGNNKAIEIFNGTLSSLDLAAGNYVLQQYDNGATNPSVSIPLSGVLAAGDSLVVGRPSDPPAYAPDAAITNLPNLLTNKSLTFNGDDVVVLRSGGANGPVLDRVGQVGTNAPSSLWSLSVRDRTLVRKSNVYTGTVGAVTSAFPLADWESLAGDTFTGLGTHDISWLDPNQPYTPAGYSLIINTNHVLMSGELSGGVGDVSFWYRVESASPGVTVSIESGPAESGPWTTNATLAGVTSTNFAYYITPINRADHPYLRIRQTDGGTNRFRIDEITVTEPATIKRLEDFEGWTDPSYALPGTYSRYGWAIQSASIAPTSGMLNTRAALLSPTNGAVTSPAFDGGVGEVRFWAKALNSGEAAYLLLQTSIDGGSNWVSRESFTVTTARTFSAWLYVTNVGAQARLAFNGAQSSGDVYLDNVEVRIPALYRNQNFDSWPTRGSYVTETIQGWFITNCIVDTQNAYQGQVARLNTTVGNYVLGPEMPGGLGTISFRTRKWSASDAAFTLQVQVSPNGVGWTTLTNVSATSTNYEQISLFLLDTTNFFVRFYHSAGSARILLDDIRVSAPTPRPQVLVTPAIDPANPTVDEPITLLADVVPRYGATVLSVTGWYSIAFGGWNSVPMESVGFGAYEATADIPGLAAGTRVRYYVRVQYAGIGAATNSTVYSTNTATSATYTNYVSTVPLGNVWINEFFYAPYGDNEPYEIVILEEDPWFLIVTNGCSHEYVELCGLEGADVSNWKIQLAFGSAGDIAANSNQAVYASYTIPPGTVFTNQTNGFSFYVLGDLELSTNHPVNQILTIPVPTNVAPYSVPDKDHIYDGVGVIRLVNQFGNIVYSLSYGGYAPGSDRVPQSQTSFGETDSIGLAGSNYTYAGFAWAMSNLTIGAVNDGQSLVPPPDDTNTYAIAWHDAELKITPVDTNQVPPFHMLDPSGAGHYDAISIHYGYTNAAYDNPGGTLYHRESGGGAWGTIAMDIKDGAADAAGHGYVYATIPARTYQRTQVIEYFIEVDPNKTGVKKVYLGTDPLNVCTAYVDMASAEAEPFTYVVPIADKIYITNFTTNATSWIFQTDGNDAFDPIVNFRIRTSTNMLTPPSLWEETNFTARITNIYGQSTFTVPKAPAGRSNIFYRIDPLWP